MSYSLDRTQQDQRIWPTEATDCLISADGSNALTPDRDGLGDGESLINRKNFTVYENAICRGLRLRGLDPRRRQPEY